MLLVFAFFGVFYSIDLGCSLVFPIMQPERRSEVFRVLRAPARRGSAGRRADEGGRASREAIFIVYRAPSVYYRKLDVSRDER